MKKINLLEQNMFISKWNHFYRKVLKKYQIKLKAQNNSKFL